MHIQFCSYAHDLLDIKVLAMKARIMGACQLQPSGSQSDVLQERLSLAPVLSGILILATK